jgi:hypothetical protein
MISYAPDIPAYTLHSFPDTPNESESLCCIPDGKLCTRNAENRDLTSFQKRFVVSLYHIWNTAFSAKHCPNTYRKPVPQRFRSDSEQAHLCDTKRTLFSRRDAFWT